MFSALPKTTEARILGKQVLRSGTSVGANYREAYRARSRAEFISKCGDLRELEETLYWLELLVDARLCPFRKIRCSPSRVRRIDRYLCHNFETLERRASDFLIHTS